MDKRTFQRHLRTVLRNLDSQIGNLPDNARVSGVVIRDASRWETTNLKVARGEEPRREFKTMLHGRVDVKLHLHAHSDERSDNLESENDPI